MFWHKMGSRQKKLSMHEGFRYSQSRMHFTRSQYNTRASMVYLESIIIILNGILANLLFWAVPFEKELAY